MLDSNNNRYNYKYSIKNFYNSISIDLVIPFRDENNRVITLLNSIFEKIKRPHLEIYLVDDASKNKSFISNFSNIPGVHLIQFDKPVGFGAAVNTAIEQCKNQAVCVMHSDTVIIEPNCLINLCEDMLSLKDRNVACISAVTDNPMNKKLDCMKFAKSEDSPPVIFENLNSPFICTLVNKQIFELCHGFPEYPLCWYEHELLGDKLKKVGFKQAYSKRSFVHHEGGSTITKLVNADKRNLDILKSNFDRYENDKKIFI